jgi:hypothetical protein
LPHAIPGGLTSTCSDNWPLAATAAGCRLLRARLPALREAPELIVGEP